MPQFRKFAKQASLSTLASLLCLLILGLIALFSWLSTSRVRRTYAFTTEKGRPIIEERSIPKTGSPEGDIRSYLDDLVLGPMSPETMPLFDTKTRVRSLMLRKGVVYLDLTRPAWSKLGLKDPSWPVMEKEIRRNFPFVKKMEIFVEGNEIFSLTH